MKRRLNDQSGIALFLVLWVLTLLSAVVGEFCYAMRTEVNITRNFRDGSQAYYIAEAGFYHAAAEMVRNTFIPPPRAAASGAGEASEAPAEGTATAPRWRINIPVGPLPFGPGAYVVVIGNESGRININTANATLLKSLLGSFDLEETEQEIIVDSIQDWRDKDDLHRLNGAEDDYYRSLPEPYESKDGPFESEEELLLVRGVTPEIFYGGLKDMVTVFPGAGSRININAASPAMLRRLPGMTDELVQAVLEYRREKDFESTQDVVDVLGADVYQAVRPYISFRPSAYYRIRSFGTLEGADTYQGIEVLIEVRRGAPRGFTIVERWDGIGAGDVNVLALAAGEAAPE